ncbi:MAG: hypothetical protein WC341_17225 [Bacteroidales bacterium]
MEYDPFDGDFGDPGDKILSDKMVLAKKEHQCFWCGLPIKPKELHRSRVDIINGELCSYRWCNDCCSAMVCDIESGTFDATAKRIEMQRRAKESDHE